LGIVTEDKESSYSSHKDILPSSGECSSEQNNERDQRQSGDGNSEQLGDINLSNEDQNSEQDEIKSRDSNDEKLGGMHLSNDDQNNDIATTESWDCNIKQPGVSEEVHLSAELVPHENEESSPMARANSEVKENGEGLPLAGANLEAGINEGDSNFRSLSTDNIVATTGSTSIATHHGPARESISPDTLTSSPNEQLEQPQKNSVVKENGEGLPLAGANLEVGINEGDSNFRSLSTDNIVATTGSTSIVTHHGPARESISPDTLISSPNEQLGQPQKNSEVKENGEGLPLAGANLEVGINEGDSNFRSLSTGNIVATTGSTSIVTHHGPARESISPDTLTSSPYEQLEQPHKILRVVDRVRSTDTIETAEFANPSSELSREFGEMSKSPTTRSYYAYEGSVSSYDGTDDQFPEHQMHSSRRNDKVANSILSEERQKKDKFLLNSMMDRKHLVSKGVFSSTKKYSANKRNKMHQDELLEPTTHGRPERNWRRHERENYPSRVPFYGMGSLAGYEDVGPSNQVHNQFHRNTSFQSSDRSDYLEQDKTKLLQIVSELQDEINKRCYLNGRANGRVSTWEEKHIPAYYDHEAPVGAFRNDLINPRFPGRGRPGSSWLQQHNFSHIPFSGETTSTRHEAHHSCLHCHPQDWQYSAQLPPPPTLFHNKGLCRLHAGNNFYNSSYNSLPSSPQRYANSEFPIHIRETKSEEQRHKDREVKKYHLAKRHFQPIAGGAPFITCYNCSSPLQLPADFLLFRKRFHQLRCGACSELLKFSLQNRTHLVPFSPVAMDPPPSEVDDYSDVINGILVSASHVNASSYADPVSCSDDYGLSYSTEGDPLPPRFFMPSKAM
jgi:hypothetical protein